jgi:hypothetical protein
MTGQQDAAVKAFTPTEGHMFFPANHPHWWAGWRASYGKEAPPPPQLSPGGPHSVVKVVQS